MDTRAEWDIQQYNIAPSTTTTKPLRARCRAISKCKIFCIQHPAKDKTTAERYVCMCVFAQHNRERMSVCSEKNMQITPKPKNYLLNAKDEKLLYSTFFGAWSEARMVHICKTIKCASDNDHYSVSHHRIEY